MMMIGIESTTFQPAAFVSTHSSCRSSHSSSPSSSFSSHSQFMGSTMKLKLNDCRSRSNNTKQKQSRGTQLSMILGTDGGILGVGAPEIAVTLLVGYFVLGPSELYKITKEIGKFIQNFRTLGSEATKTLENSMENQLQMEELRKAQFELNNAFNFRRSINVDQEAEAFSEIPPINQDLSTSTAAAGTYAVAPATAALEQSKKRKLRRRVKKKKPVEENVLPFEEEEYDFSNFMSKSTTTTTPITPNIPDLDTPVTTNNGQTEQVTSSSPDWFNTSEENIASTVLSQQEQDASNSRFASQLNGSWNESILANEEKLSPLGTIMEKLALLEEERMATEKRLEEEFLRRQKMEEEFYMKKKLLLEEAAAQVSADVYGSSSS
jgi:Sec-independent protein translocase protein TatA